MEIGDGIPFTEETLSAERNIHVNTVKLGLQTFKKLKMIEYFNDQSIYISNFEKHQELDRIEIGREKLRLRVKKSRDNKKQMLIGNGNVTVTPVTCNAIEPEQDQEKEPEQESKINFDIFWNEYDKKADKPKCLKKWNRFPLDVQQEIIAYIPHYKKSTPDKKYRKNPYTFLNNQSWENEIVHNGNTPIVLEWEKCVQIAKDGGRGIKELDPIVKKVLQDSGGLMRLRTGSSFVVNEMEKKFINIWTRHHAR